MITIDQDNIIDNDNDINTRVKVLEFTLNGESYGIAIADAKEVVEVPRLTKIPYAPTFVKGAMNLRGEIITVIDIRDLLGLDKQQRAEQPKVIVTDITGTAMGIIADTVRGTLDIDAERIQLSILSTENHMEDHIKGQVQLDHYILVILDLHKILMCEAIIKLRQGRKSS